MANGVIKKGGELPCPVDASGVFTDTVTDFKNQYVKVRINLISYESCSLPRFSFLYSIRIRLFFYFLQLIL